MTLDYMVSPFYSKPFIFFLLYRNSQLHMTSHFPFWNCLCFWLCAPFLQSCIYSTFHIVFLSLFPPLCLMFICYKPILLSFLIFLFSLEIFNLFLVSAVKMQMIWIHEIYSMSWQLSWYIEVKNKDYRDIMLRCKSCPW